MWVVGGLGGDFLAGGVAAGPPPLFAAARSYARLNAAGRQGEAGFAGSAAAAALLYDMAPRHAAVQERVRARLAGESGPEADTLRLILRENGR